MNLRKSVLLDLDFPFTAFCEVGRGLGLVASCSLGGRCKGLMPAPNSAGWEGGTRVAAECCLQRRHRDRLLDEWQRTASGARTWNACRPHALASVAPLPGVAYHSPRYGSAGSRWQRRRRGIHLG